MSKNGHLLTAAALAFASYQATADPALSLVVVVASSFPDLAEGVAWSHGRRLSLIPHRTLTHWLPAYAAAWVLAMLAAPALSRLVRDLVEGICLANALHVLMDLCSPMGVPLLLPFGKRISAGLKRPNGHRCLYRTGFADELPLIGATCGLFLAVAWVLAPHRPPAQALPLPDLRELPAIVQSAVRLLGGIVPRP